MNNIHSIHMPSTRGAARIRLGPDEYERFLRAGLLVTDAHRSLPLPFEGRFFAASDWIREQSYFLRRQADLGRAIGAGVMAGLEVSPGDSATRLSVLAGHGLTGAGEMVMLEETVSVDVGDLAGLLELSQALGVSGVPRHPARTRSGLFVLALRPVEYTANDVASYPSSLDEERSLQHGDVIEGVVLTLIPFPEPGSMLEGDRRRARVARTVFVDQHGELNVPEALPLAMVALRRGLVDWVDMHMVRREIGRMQSDILGFAPGWAAARAAHLHQYHAHLDQVLQAQGPEAPGFAAIDYFDVLPPVGRLPRSAIDQPTLTQHYFPASVDVHLMALPADELPVLVEEALRLPVIDLTQPEEDLAAISILVLAPLSRGYELARQSLEPAAVTPLASRYGVVQRALPADRLISAFAGRDVVFAAQPEAPAPASGSVVAWQNLLASADDLWFMRVRTQHVGSLEFAHPVPVIGDEFGDEKYLVQYLKGAQLYEIFHHLKTSASASADWDMVRWLSQGAFYQSRILAAGALYELQGGRPRLSRKKVSDAALRFDIPDLGEGLARIEGTEPSLADHATIRIIGKSLRVPELDQLGNTLSDADLNVLIGELNTAVATGRPEAVRDAIDAQQ